MKAEFDAKYEAQLTAIAARSGRTVDEVIADLIERGLCGMGDPPPQNWKTELITCLTELKSLPLESVEDGFSGADHDEILYPRNA